MNNGYKTLSMMIIEAANKLRINCSAANVVEVGSGLGGLTTTLAQSFKSVVGIDHHQDNVTFSKKVWDDKKVAYHLEGENGELMSNIITIPSSATPVEYRCSDYTCIPAEMLGFDVVVLNDVIDKVCSSSSLLLSSLSSSLLS